MTEDRGTPGMAAAQSYPAVRFILDSAVQLDGQVPDLKDEIRYGRPQLLVVLVHRVSSLQVLLRRTVQSGQFLMPLCQLSSPLLRRLPGVPALGSVTLQLHFMLAEAYLHGGVQITIVGQFDKVATRLGNFRSLQRSTHG